MVSGFLLFFFFKRSEHFIITIATLCEKIWQRTGQVTTTLETYFTLATNITSKTRTGEHPYPAMLESGELFSCPNSVHCEELFLLLQYMRHHSSSGSPSCGTILNTFNANSNTELFTLVLISIFLHFVQFS